MKQFLLVFIGGGLGSVFRFLISQISCFNYSKFPAPTLLSNIIGCLILGIVLGNLQGGKVSELIVFGTAYKVSIERDNFKAIEVTDLNNLSAEKVFERLINSLN